MPTYCRTSVIGVLGALSRVGSIAAMQINKLGLLTSSTTFCIFAISAAICVFFLPESFQKPMLQTLAEANDFHEGEKRNKKESDEIYKTDLLPSSS